MGKSSYDEKISLCKTVFCKKRFKCGGNSIDAFKLIKRVEDLARGKLVKDISKEDLLELENILEYID